MTAAKVTRIISESLLGYTRRGWRVNRVQVAYADGEQETLYRTTINPSCIYGLDETHPPIHFSAQPSLFEEQSS